MEGDFDGDLFDLPSDAENNDEQGEQDDDEEQRLDQEMGDVGAEGQVGSFLSNTGTSTLFISSSCADDMVPLPGVIACWCDKRLQTGSLRA